VLTEDVRSDPLFFLGGSIELISKDEIIRALMESMLEAVEASNFPDETSGIWSGTISALSSCVDPMWVAVIYSILDLFFDNLYITGAKQLLHQLRGIGLLEFDTPRRSASMETPMELRRNWVRDPEAQDPSSIQTTATEDEEDVSRYLFAEEDPWYLKARTIIREVMYIFCLTYFLLHYLKCIVS
jgi:hypothetical protein